MKAYSISMMCQGESSTSVHRSLKTLSIICPEILENEDGSIGELILAVDGTDVSNESLLNIGVFNSRSDYVCIATRLIRGKDHEAISDTMKEMVSDYPALVPKLIGIMSDQCPAQIKANARFAELIGRKMGIDFVQYLCSLHSTKNQRDY